MFQESLEMTQAQFFDEQFSMSFDNIITMIIEMNKTRSSNVENVYNAISRQHFVNTSKTPSSSTESINFFDFSAINNQNSINSCSASKFRLFELHLRIYQFINNDQRDLISETTNDVIGDFECESHEYHNNNCALND